MGLLRLFRIVRRISISPADPPTAPSRIALRMRTIHEVMQQIRGEYLEMPGLRLTPNQLQRLCGIEHTLCRLVLDALVTAKFLCLTANGHYARLTDGEISSRKPAKADLRADKPAVKAS